VTTPQVPFVDMGNTLLTQVQSQLDTGSVTTPAGKIGLITIRTASTTLTVFLGADDLRQWSELLAALANELTSGLMQATIADVAAVAQPLAAYRRR
jgi:hypothetical protein